MDFFPYFLQDHEIMDYFSFLLQDHEIMDIEYLELKKTTEKIIMKSIGDQTSVFPFHFSEHMPQDIKDIYVVLISNEQFSYEQ